MASTELYTSYGGKYTLEISVSASGRNVYATATIRSADGSSFSDYACNLSVSISGLASNSTGVSSISSGGSASVSTSGTGSYSTTYTATATWTGKGGYSPSSGSVSASATTGASPVPTYSLGIGVTGSGTVTGGGSMTSGTVRTITATPSNDYEFSNWIVNYGNTPVSLTDAITTITITTNTSLTAVFTEQGSGSVYKNGVWTKAKFYIYKNGWKVAKPYIYKNNNWRKCK